MGSLAPAAASIRDRISQWIFRTRGPEATPIILTQRRVFVLPTRPGLVFAAALVAMLLAAMNYQLSLGFALTFLLAGLGNAAILHTFRNLARLEIDPGATPPVFCDELAVFSLRLTNRRSVDRYALRLTAGNSVCDIEQIDSGHASLATLTLPTKSRGWLHLPRTTIETRFPLGLIRSWSYVQPDMRVLVYPRPEPNPPPLPLGQGNASGTAQSRAGSDDFAGLRNHQPADSPRHIAWKASAGDRPLLTKHFSGTQAGEVALRWEDLPPSLDVEARLSRLAAWVCRAHASGMSWGLDVPGHHFGAAQGETHAAACLKALALFGSATHDCDA